MTATIWLPGRSRPLPVPAPLWAASHPPPATRRVYAAAHVAAHADGSIDWPSTLGFRDYLWRHGFAVAEAMDTAQRGTGLSFEQAAELITRSAGLAAQRGAAVAAGAGTDQLTAGRQHSIAAITAAFAEQVSMVESACAQVILMASRELAAAARSAGDYLQVYGQLASQASGPVILHWLGEAFDPQLAGYWGSQDADVAADTVAELIGTAGGKIDGIKLSLLDARREIALRRRLPPGVRLYTGDDFHYAELIKGDAAGHSDALLGAFAAIAAPAAEALQALDSGDTGRYDAIMGPTVTLSRTIFEQPTPSYKAGIAFLAWLNGLQPHFCMLDGFQRRRSAGHLIRVFELAAAAGALTEPELAVDRMSRYLAAGYQTAGQAG